MSAVERLRELDETATRGPWIVNWYGADEHGERGVQSISLGEDDFIETDGTVYGPEPRNAILISTLRNVLPQIVAVIGAADHLSVWVEHGCDHFANGKEAVTAYRSALAALDAKLSVT